MAIGIEGYSGKSVVVIGLVVVLTGGEFVVCAFFTLVRYFCLSTFSTTSVRADRETQALRSQHYDTEIVQCDEARRVDNEYHAIVLGTTNTTYTWQQPRYIEREEGEK